MEHSNPTLHCLRDKTSGLLKYSKPARSTCRNLSNFSNTAWHRTAMCCIGDSVRFSDASSAKETKMADEDLILLGFRVCPTPSVARFLKAEMKWFTENDNFMVDLFEVTCLVLQPANPVIKLRP